MRLETIDTGFFKLDGGAMFGIVPKSIWKHLNPPDDKNLCTWAMRCLFIEIGAHRILVDTGLGNKQSEKFFSYFEPHGEASLEGSLQKIGVATNEITDVVLTHLHFDHCGGAVKREGEILKPAFPNATYWTQKDHWEWASNPNEREKASFLKENFEPLESSNQLQFAEDGKELFPGLKFQCVFGHTEAMMLPHITYKGHTLVYMADLIPSSAHIRLPYIMAYDVRPLKTLEEKKRYLSLAYEEKHIFIFEHDKEVECCNLKKTERGITVDQKFKLSEL